jgi:hypothetical protein
MFPPQGQGRGGLAHKHSTDITDGGSLDLDVTYVNDKKLKEVLIKYYLIIS